VPYAKSATLIVALTSAITILLPLISSQASACSLAHSIDWLDFVESHGLAHLNPDCTVTWKTGVVTDLNGNPISPPYAFLQENGVLSFFAGLILAVAGVYLTVRSVRMNNKATNPQS
jgi:hypothetical protein